MVTFLLFVLTVVCNVVGNVCFKMAARMTATFGSVPFWEFLKSAMNKCFFIGVLGFALSFPSFLALLSRQKLSLVYPILLAVTFVCITLISVFGFKEDLTVTQYIGIFIIITGIALLAKY